MERNIYLVKEGRWSIIATRISSRYSSGVSVLFSVHRRDGSHVMASVLLSPFPWNARFREMKECRQAFPPLCLYSGEGGRKVSMGRFEIWDLRFEIWGNFIVPPAYGKKVVRSTKGGIWDLRKLQTIRQKYSRMAFSGNSGRLRRAGRFLDSTSLHSKWHQGGRCSARVQRVHKVQQVQRVVAAFPPQYLAFFHRKGLTLLEMSPSKIPIISLSSICMILPPAVTLCNIPVTSSFHNFWNDSIKTTW